MRKVEFDEMRMVEAGGWIHEDGFICYRSEDGKTYVMIGLGSIIIGKEDYQFIYSPGVFMFNIKETPIMIYTPLYLVRLLIGAI